MLYKKFLQLTCKVFSTHNQYPKQQNIFYIFSGKTTAAQKH